MSDPGAVPAMTSHLAESGKGSGFKMTGLTTLNLPATAPMASARVPTEVMRKPGVRNRARQAWRRSVISSASMSASPSEVGVDQGQTSVSPKTLPWPYARLRREVSELNGGDVKRETSDVRGERTASRGER